MDLNRRRAKWIYECARLGAIAASAPVVPIPWEEREEPFREQFLAIIEKQCGAERSDSPDSPEALHNSWVEAYIKMGWVYGPTYSPQAKTHPDLVAYAELNQIERDKDDVFVALCDIARKWIYTE